MRLFGGVRLIDRPCLANVMRLDLGAMPLVAQMNANGLRIDPDHFRRLETRLSDKAEGVRSRIVEMAGWDINPSSGAGDQVARLLYDQLKLEIPGGERWTPSRSRLTTDADTLSSMQTMHPVVPLILNYRELEKLITTYCRPLPLHMASDGRIRTRLNMNVARTGRLTSEDPNLQNIPVQSEEGRQIRAGFIASDGCVLSSIDLSQIEMVWAAELSGDENMRKVFLRGADLHVVTACALFRLDYDLVSGLWKEYKAGKLNEAGRETDLAFIRDFEINKRLPSKCLGFAILYGVTPRGLQLQILSAGGPLWTEEECAFYIDRWFEAYPWVALWMEKQYNRVRRYGMVWTAFGRHRLIPEVRSVLQRVVEAGLREAGNQPVQGSAGDHLKLGMAEVLGLVDYYNSFDSTICRPCLQIHDELMFELTPNIAQEFNYEVCKILQEAVPMSVPVRSAASIAQNWAELK